ncbi:MAG: glycosyltransferase [Paludibacter sp.]|nr:glycosyltransferase [Paludibacter sp.]
MKKVVVVAYAFPPVGGGGVQRPTKFVKYLREFGWEPVVVTVANPSVPLLDDSLLKDIPSGVKIYHARTLEPSYSSKQQFGSSSGGGVSARIKAWLKGRLASVLLPDVQVLWWPGLVIKLIEVIRTERPDCLFVTAPPFSSFVPVVALGRFFNIPVIVDFRDEWSFSRHQWEHAVKSPLAFWLDKILERYVVRNCTGLVSVNASYIKSLSTAYPELDLAKTTVITNGFDEDDFKDIPITPRVDDRLTIVYAGTVWNGNSLEPFVKALKKLILDNPMLVEKLKVSVYGRVVDSQLMYLQDPVLADTITLFGYQNHSTVLKEMFNADVLLLSMTALPGAEKIILGKVFEYVATGNHILAIAPTGETRDILEQNYANLSVASPDDVDEIYSILIRLTKPDHTINKLSRSNLGKFTRSQLSRQLAEMFDKRHSCF